VVAAHNGDTQLGPDKLARHNARMETTRTALGRIVFMVGFKAADSF
jgi:hypothetical protein